MDETLIMEIWDTFREYIPEKNKEMAANQYVDWLLGKDIDTEDLEGWMGFDPHLDDAIKAVLDENAEFEDAEDDNYGNDEDEDY
jgi:hypothetical protein